MGHTEATTVDWISEDGVRLNEIVALLGDRELDEDTLSAVREKFSQLVPAWLRWWMFSHHVNYHIEHHLYPSIPHYNSPHAHRALRMAVRLQDGEAVPVGLALGRIFGPRAVTIS